MFKSYSTSFVSKSFVKIRWRQDTWQQSVFGSPQVTTFPPPRSAQKEPCHSNQRKAWSKSGGVKGLLYISILTISWIHWIINWWVSTVSTCLEIPGPRIQQFASATAQKSDNHFVTSFVDPWDKVLTVPGFWSIIMCFVWYRAQSKAIHQATLRWGNASHIFQLLLDSCGIPTCRAGHKKWPLQWAGKTEYILVLPAQFSCLHLDFQRWPQFCSATPRRKRSLLSRLPPRFWVPQSVYGLQESEKGSLTLEHLHHRHMTTYCDLSCCNSRNI